MGMEEKEEKWKNLPQCKFSHYSFWKGDCLLRYSALFKMDVTNVVLYMDEG